MNKKIKLNFFRINFIITIIAIVISCLSIYNILLTDGQSSYSFPSEFDISECDELINATTLRGMVHGSITNDCLNGGKGNDILYGDLGYDMLNGNEGDDQIIGDSGNDKLYGGLGDDDLVGGLGDDLLDGGRGKWCT